MSRVEMGVRNARQAVDREVSLDVAVLRALSASREIDAGDWRAFHDVAASVAANARPGSWIVLYDRTGRTIVNTKLPFGTPATNFAELYAAHPETEWNGRSLPTGGWNFRAPFETARPSFTGVVYAPVLKRPGVGTVVPVLREGRPVYALALVYGTEFFDKLLQAEGAPGLITSIYDQRGRFVARSRNSGKYVGKEGLQPFTIALGPQETAREASNIEGSRVLYANSVAAFAGYVVSNSVPKEAILAPARRALLVWLAVLLSAGGLGAVFGWRLWRRVGTPLAALARQARSLGEIGVEAPASDLEEVDTLRAALLEAGRNERIRGEAERDAKRAEAALRESEARLRLALDAAKFGTFDLDIPRGKLRWDAPKIRMWGIPEGEEFEYPAVLDAMPPEDRDRVEAAVEQSFRTGEYESEYRVIWPDGSVHWLYARGRVEFEEGKPVRMLGVELDITDRKLAEEALQRANAQLREADRRKDEFLSMLSHELRNPLAPILSSVYVLRGAESGTPRAERARTVIERQAEHLTRIVDDLLDVTRIARGKIILHRERLDLREVVARAVEDANVSIEEREVKLEVQLPAAPLWADGDATRITQVLGNLLANARKFTRPGDEIDVSLREIDGAAEIRVRDTGAGIDPHLLQSLFDPFVQGERTLARSEGGLGLGLALVRGLVELHGGTVRAHSEGQGRGAEFVVVLPLAAPGRSEGRAEPVRERPPAGAKRYVLVVDDNADAAESMAQVVELFGHEVAVAYDGPAAIEKARQKLPDVVLCDLGLPGMSGYDVARALRAEFDGALRLVAISGYAQAEDRQRSAEAGFDAHLAKPAEPDAIQQLLG